MHWGYALGLCSNLQCTCKHTEGGGFAGAIHPQKAKGFPFGDAQPKAVHSPDWRPERPLTILLLQAFQKHLPLLLLTTWADVHAPQCFACCDVDVAAAVLLLCAVCARVLSVHVCCLCVRS